MDGATKRIAIGVIVVFVVYALYYDPERVADVVINIWNVAAHGLRSIGEFFRHLLG